MRKVRFSNGIQGKGFAAALALSICAVGISTYAAYTGAMTRTEPDTSESRDYDEHVFIFSDENDGREEAASVNAEKLDVPKETTAEEKADEAGMIFGSPKTMPIANAKVINPYSNGELVKSETLGVWKTHDGADLAADAGTAVSSMMKGTVTEVKDDALWGICVVIDHGDGVVAHYCNLSENVKVREGQEVAMGEIIGQVGNTADIECKLQPHLHFGVTQNGKWTDPIAFVG